MSLQTEIDDARAEIRTDSYAVSIGEWISLYERGELDIHPEFQRFFRWTPEQKSRLVESILLGIPVPQIFVSQRPDGVWDVVDGLQRLSTIYQLVGILRNTDGEQVEPLVLTRAEYLPSLEGRMWDAPNDPTRSLTGAQRLLVKRAKLDVSIILRESEERTKYELFQRLNTGGSHLSDQEVRNAVLVMLNADLYRWIEDLAARPDFLECIALSDRSLDIRYDMELVLRFLTLRRASDEALKNIGDLGHFLTQEMRTMAGSQGFNESAAEVAFDKTFSLLNNCLGSEAFRRWDGPRDKAVGGFSVSAFEAVALGIGYEPATAVDNCKKLSELVHGIWRDEEFTANSGSGIRAGSRIPRVVPYGRKRFRV